MCTVNINVDEVALRDMRPELVTEAAIRLWAQELVNLHIQQMLEEHGRDALHSEATQEKLWYAIEQDPELTLKPSVVDVNDGEAVDLETFRADLHRMIEDIYAEA